MDTFSHLFSPFKLGDVGLRNRIVMLPMTTGYADGDQTIGKRLVDYYAARARGGAGLIIAPVSPIRAGSPVDAGMYDDRFIPGARRLTDTVHGHGAKISALLIVCYHLVLDRGAGAAADTGDAAAGADLGARAAEPEVVGPSPIVNALLRAAPRELTPDEIAWIVGEYGRAAGRAKSAGFDLVEIMAGGGYLVNRFLSPLSNTRTDEYGGSVDRRTRFLREIIGSVRSTAGEDFPVTVRLNLQENIEGGYGIAEALEIAKILEEMGIVGLTTYVGRHESPVPTVQASVPQAGFIHLTEQLKDAVRIPVTAANRIRDPLVADRILAEGRADLAGMGRALLADPELPNKAREGRSDEIVPCLACSNCLAAMLTTYKKWGQPASAICSVNPAVGKEAEAALEPAATTKKVVVIGAGPAGLEAAWVAAERGHDVTVYEAAAKAGGKLLIGAVPPHKEAMGVLAESLATRVLRAGAELRLGTRADRRLVEEERPDVLIVAAGGTFCRPEIPGAGGENVFSAEEVLRGEQMVAGRVLVVGGGMVGCETAEYIQQSFHHTGRVTGVTVVEMLHRLAGDVSATSRPFFLARLREQGIRFMSGARVVRIDSDGLEVVRTVDGGDVEETVLGDCVVLATGYTGDEATVAEFAELVGDTYVIGDCVDARLIRDAMTEGFAAGRVA